MSDDHDSGPDIVAEMRAEELENSLAEALQLMDDMVFELPIQTGRKFADRMTALRKVLEDR